MLLEEAACSQIPQLLTLCWFPFLGYLNCSLVPSWGEFPLATESIMLVNCVYLKKEKYEEREVACLEKNICTLALNYQALHKYCTGNFNFCVSL